MKTEDINDSAQILRDILQNREKQMQENIGNNNSIKEICGNIQEDSCQTSDLEKMTMKAMATTYRGDNHEQESEHSSDELSLDGSDYGSDQNQLMDEMEGSESMYDMKNNDRNSVDGDENKEAKRARVENILSHIRQSPPSPGDQGDNHSQEVRRPKRKQYQPQQHDSKFLDHSGNKYRKLEKLALQDQLLQLQQQLQLVQKRYLEIQYDDEQVNGEEENESPFQFRMNLDKPLFNHKMFENEPLQMNRTNHIKEKINRLCEEPNNQQARPVISEPLQQLDVSNLTNSLKTKITDAVSNAVESVVCELLKDKPKRVENEKPKSKPEPVPSPIPVREIPERVKEEKPKLMMPQPPPFRSSPMREPMHDHIGQMARILEKASAFEPPRGLTPDFNRPPHLHPSLPFHLPFSYFPQSHLLHPPSIYSCAPLSESEQTEPLPLVVNTPKKKRTKVTDTRISPKTARALLGQDPMSFAHLHMEQSEQRHHFPGLIPHHLPTSVAIPNPSLQNPSDILGFYRGEHQFGDPRSSNHSPLHADHPSPSCSVSSPSDSYKMFEGSDSFDGHHMHVTSTLTPMHLRKAKLMFFYVRYPSSAILKVYFPDVKFNKNNTAQLVKWFSNFREFYYIQMEKYARQAIAEGVKHAEDLVVSTDAELYRILNLHYNRNNQIEVPDNFRMVVQATYREFFKSVMANKDTEPSWKKAIYKVIARMDDVLPEYFKSPNWMDQLGDM